LTPTGRYSKSDPPKTTIRIEFRAVAVNRGDIEEDRYEGEACATPHEAHLALERRWTVNRRDVILEKRRITETAWEKVEG
jgi:hypothetical protein